MSGIVKKVPKINTHEYCIYDFNIIEHNAEEETPVFYIQIFANNVQGEDASIIVDDYSPFFYIQVPDNWKGDEKTKLFNSFKSKLGTNWESLLPSSLHQSKTLYGFDNGKKYNFIILRFANMIGFNKIKNLWYEYAENSDAENPTSKEYQLKKDGFLFNGSYLKLYESNIPPLLRYLHINSISPSGWISVNARKMRQNILECDKVTHCKYEFMGGQNQVISLPNKEARCPFKKESMDIEASSSHGDFPIPVKNYKKLASQIIELLINTKEKETKEKTDKNKMQLNVSDLSHTLRQILLAAFECKLAGDANTESSIQKIDVVFPKKPILSEDLDGCITKWLSARVLDYSTDKHLDDLKKSNTMNKLFSNNNIKFVKKCKKDELITKKKDKEAEEEEEDKEDEDKEEEDKEEEDKEEDDENEEDKEEEDEEDEKEEDEENGNVGYVKREEPIILCPKKAKTTIVDVLNNPAYIKEAKVNELLLSLNAHFPPLQGDQVTFIGSTFMREGEKEMYLNHCIVLNTCDKLPLPNSEIEVYETEREVLLAWTRLMHRENPDIIIGYNIFGFDYQFMYYRAIECDCLEEFLLLSKNKNDVCGNFDIKRQIYDIERSSIKISTGTYDLAIIKMPGRLQVDMLNYFRRTDTSMSSYKLDSVSSEIIGDIVTDKTFINEINVKIETTNPVVRCQTKNMMGLDVDCWVHFILENHSSQYFNKGKKYRVVQINKMDKWFDVEFMSNETMLGLTAQKVKWGLAKDDVTPKDIFRLTHEGPSARMIVAKYCIQDCNLVHHLFNKVDVLTGLSEMSRLCSVPMSYLVFRGQGIKLTSFLAKKCRERGILMPVIQKGNHAESYEGALVLIPKTGIYLLEGVPVGDFASLYPSCMQSENICLSSKVWTKIFNLEGALIKEFGIKNAKGEFKYDNLKGRQYANIKSKTYEWQIPPPKLNAKPTTKKPKAAKVCTGYRICRFDQTQEGVLPSILKELLKARKDTRKQIPGEADPFMKNILNQRQLTYKGAANSIYGQTGAKTSTFYDLDIAASTTAIGQKCLIFAKDVIEECYGNEDIIMTTKEDGDVLIRPSYVYGDTDSVFFKLNARYPVSKELISGEKGIKITIELSQVICNTVSKFLKRPHDFEYEKTFWPFILFSKKKYSGEKYEYDHTKHKRNNMGNAAVKRDTPPITRDLLGRVTDIIMRDKDMLASIELVKQYIHKLLAGKISVDQFVITKSLSSSYKNPNAVAHKVLAERIADREPGNKPTSGDRIPFVYIINSEKVRIAALKGKAKKDAPKVLQGNCIETPTFIKANPELCKIDYGHYITNQLMNPLTQLFALALEDIWTMQKKDKSLRYFKAEVDTLIAKTKATFNAKYTKMNKLPNTWDITTSKLKIDDDDDGKTAKQKLECEAELNEKIAKKITKLREKKTADAIFGPFILELKNNAYKNQNISLFLNPKK